MNHSNSCSREYKKNNFFVHVHDNRNKKNMSLLTENVPDEDYQQWHFRFKRGCCLAHDIFVVDENKNRIDIHKRITFVRYTPESDEVDTICVLAFDGSVIAAYDLLMKSPIRLNTEKKTFFLSDEDHDKYQCEVPDLEDFFFDAHDSNVLRLRARGARGQHIYLVHVLPSSLKIERYDNKNNKFCLAS